MKKNITVVAQSALTVTGVLVLVTFTGFNKSASATVPYVNERVSTDGSNNQVTDFTWYGSNAPAISQDGRYVAFESGSSQLVYGDTNGLHDIFVKDRQTGSITRANTTSTGAQMTTGSLYFGPVMSDNGRYIGFITDGYSALDGNNLGNTRQAYVKDMQTGAVDVISQSTSGTFANHSVYGLALSADGRYATFFSNATNLVSGITSGTQDVYVRDRLLNLTSLVSQTPTGGNPNGSSGMPTISCDGAYIAYTSAADNIVSGDTNGNFDIFLYDRISGTTKDVTLGQDNYSPFSSYPHLSCDGSTLIFTSNATNLVSGDVNGQEDTFAYDIFQGTTEIVTLSSTGGQSTFYPSPDYSVRATSYDGRYVVFGSYDNGLVSGDSNSHDDIYLRDRKLGTTQLISKRNSTTATNDDSLYPSITEDGKYVVFLSSDSGLVSGDTNATADIFVSETGI